MPKVVVEARTTGMGCEERDLCSQGVHSQVAEADTGPDECHLV